jgi:hypothetical protein
MMDLNYYFLCVCAQFLPKKYVDSLSLLFRHNAMLQPLRTMYFSAPGKACVPATLDFHASKMTVTTSEL